MKPVLQLAGDVNPAAAEISVEGVHLMAPQRADTVDSGLAFKHQVAAEVSQSVRDELRQWREEWQEWQEKAQRRQLERIHCAIQMHSLALRAQLEQMAQQRFQGGGKQPAGAASEEEDGSARNNPTAAAAADPSVANLPLQRAQDRHQTWHVGSAASSPSGLRLEESPVRPAQPRVTLRLPDDAVRSGSSPVVGRPMWTSQANSQSPWRPVEEADGTPMTVVTPANALSRQDTDRTGASEVKSWEEGRLKNEWKDHIKSRLSKRLGSIDGTRRPTLQLIMPDIITQMFQNLKQRYQGKQAHYDHPTSPLENVVDSVAFHVFCGFSIFANAVLIGIQTDLSARAAANDPDSRDPDWFYVCHVFFIGLVLAEVLLRIMAKGARFFLGDDWRWNWFDFLIAAYSLVELILESLSDESRQGYTRLLRVARMVRLLRLTRTMRFFRELRLMVCSIIQSLVSLTWALVLLLVIMYLFTICFLHGATSYQRSTSVESLEGSQREEHEEAMQGLELYYGSVSNTMFSLLMAISGGEDWSRMVEPLGQIHWGYRILFAFYVMFILVGVLNVLTSVFVQRAKELVTLDRDLVIQTQKVSHDNFISTMKSIFEEVDHDGTGKITWDKFLEYLRNEDLQAYFATQQLDTSDARELFNLLDVEDKKEVEIEEFVMGCMRLRGQARSSDLATLIRESKRHSAKAMKVMRKMEKQIGIIFSSVHGAALGGGDWSAASWMSPGASSCKHGGRTPARRNTSRPSLSVAATRTLT